MLVIYYRIPDLSLFSSKNHKLEIYGHKIVVDPSRRQNTFVENATATIKIFKKNCERGFCW